MDQRGRREIDVVRALREQIKVESAAASVGALLDANAGRIATLLVDERECTGKLLAAPEPETPPAASDGTPSVASWSGSLAPAAERLVLLEVNGKLHASIGAA